MTLSQARLSSVSRTFSWCQRQISWVRTGFCRIAALCMILLPSSTTTRTPAFTEPLLSSPAFGAPAEAFSPTHPLHRSLQDGSRHRRGHEHRLPLRPNARFVPRSAPARARPVGLVAADVVPRALRAYVLQNAQHVGPELERQQLVGFVQNQVAAPVGLQPGKQFRENVSWSAKPFFFCSKDPLEGRSS